jgi:Fe/S biogenesis protein NfuA
MTRIMVEMPDSSVPLLTITDPARSRVLEVRAGESDPEALALWIEVTGTQGNAFTYDMYFRRVDEAGDADVVQHGDDLSVVVLGAHVESIRGSTLDLSGGGMVLQNPNTPNAPGAHEATELDLDDPVVAKVVEVLAVQINPQIAAHGGFAELVAVEGPIAYLRMGGGCQGCGLAAVTLSQGIEVAILDAVPEIAEVVDVTDHASGTNPYYEAAKK